MKPTIINLTTAPPSLNNMFTNASRGLGDGRRGRIVSKQYAAWRTDAGWELKSQWPTKHEGQVMIEISVGRCTSKADGDNLVKPLFDLLVTHQVIRDDSKKYVDGFAFRWRELPGLTITVTPLAAISLTPPIEK